MSCMAIAMGICSTVNAFSILLIRTLLAYSIPGRMVRSIIIGFQLQLYTSLVSAFQSSMDRLDDDDKSRGLKYVWRFKW